MLKKREAITEDCEVRHLKETADFVLLTWLNWERIVCQDILIYLEGITDPENYST